MNLINWNENLMVHVKTFDDQHHKLIDTINKLHAAMLNRQSKDVLGEILKELIDYTVYHFHSEEELMEKHHYPYFRTHQDEHKIFVDKVSEFNNEFQSGNQFISIEILTFLSDWINKHIKSTDNKYSDFFQNLSVS